MRERRIHGEWRQLPPLRAACYTELVTSYRAFSAQGVVSIGTQL